MTSAVALYEQAADAAERVLEQPIAAGIAGVLALAAYERRQAPSPVVLGTSNAMTALALSVLEVAGESPPAPLEPRRRR